MHVEPWNLGKIAEVDDQLHVLLHPQEPVAFLELEHRCWE